MSKNTLTYLEEKLLHPTRSARFEAARRMRLTHQYALWGQGLSAVAMIAWSIVPVFYPYHANGGHLAFFSVVASVYILAVTLHQQAAGYVDRARSFEASARRIDALRREVQASISHNKDDDPDEFLRLANSYSEVLEENPINHDTFDYKLAVAKSGSYESYGLKVLLHLKAAISFLLCVVFVVALPIIVLGFSHCLVQPA